MTISTGFTLKAGGDADRRGTELGKTNENGEYYSDTGLPAGNYFVATSNMLGYIDEVYGGLPCAGCNPRTGTAVAVTAESTTEGINIVLGSGPQIRGRVTASDTGLGLRGFVEILNASGQFVCQVITDSSGIYANGPGLPPGDYYARATGFPQPYVSELYRDIPCVFGCDFRTGEKIAVTDVAPPINFELNRGGTISGTVTDARTATRLSGITVELYDAAGRMLISTISNASVPSYSFPGLADGTYYLRTTNSLGYVNEVFDDIKCIVSCNVTSGTARVVAGPVTLVTDFALDLAGGRHRAVRK